MNLSCSVGSHALEDILHIIRDYTLAKEVWRQVVLRNHQFNFFSNALLEWLSQNLQVNSEARSGEIN